MKLNMKRRTKKRLPMRDPAPLDVPAEINNSWSFDFMSDTLYSGTRFRVLNIIDEGVREALDIVVDTSITAGRVVRVLNLLKSQRGVPKSIRVDNGPEMTAHAFADWCRENDVRINYIHPESQTRMRISNDLTEHTGPKCSIRTSSRHSRRCAISAGHGCSATTKNVPTKAWGIYRRPNSNAGSQQKTLF